MGTNENVSKKQKVGKIVSYVVNIISVMIMLFSVFIVVTYLASKDRGYPTYFGRAYCVVQSDSMAKDLTKSDNFQEGDIICFRVLNDAEKQNLKVGDVITFWDNNITTTKVLNTHRIYEIRLNGEGKKEFSTMGDNNLTYDKDQTNQQIWRSADDVQGVFVGKAPGIGNVLMFLQSRTGFAVLIVVPCVMIMLYCATLVILNLVKYTKQKAVIQHEDNVEALREQMKAELLKEMAEQRKKEEEAAAAEKVAEAEPKAEEKPEEAPAEEKPAEKPKEKAPAKKKAEKPADNGNKDE